MKNEKSKLMKLCLRVFGKLKNWKIDPQKFKEEIREERGC